MLFGILLLVPGLINFATSSFTPVDPETGVSYELLLSRLGLAPLRNGVDRRMTHSESRSHSNFDNENMDRGQISYPSILDETTLSRVPMNFEIPVKSRSPNFEETRNIMNPKDSRLDDRFVETIPELSITSWLLSSEARGRSLEGTRNLPVRTGKMPRCRRIIDENWMIEEPMYVEEPGWILIELNNEKSGIRKINREDPFYVARGKRRDKMGIITKRRKFGEIVEPDDDGSEGFSGSASMRGDAFGQNLRKYVLEDSASGIISSGLTEARREIQPRNKNSDILDILREPFFISRGKKGIERSESNDDCSSMNYETTRQISDTRRSGEAKRNCDASSSECSRRDGTMKNKPGAKPFRDRRGLMEELLKEADPFYVARGKRSSNETASELIESAKIINKKMSYGVSRSIE